MDDLNLTPEMIQAILGLSGAADQDRLMEAQLAQAQRIREGFSTGPSVGLGAGLANGLMQGLNQGQAYRQGQEAQAAMKKNAEDRLKYQQQLMELLRGQQKQPGMTQGWVPPVPGAT